MDSLKTPTSTHNPLPLTKAPVSENPSSPPGSRIKEYLQDPDTSGLANQEAGQSLVHRHTKEQKAEDPIWERAEFYELPGPVSQFTQRYSELYKAVDKSRRDLPMYFSQDLDLQISPCDLPSKINNISQDFKNHTVLAPLSPNLAAYADVSLDKISLHRELSIDSVMHHLDSFSTEYLDQARQSEKQLQQLDLSQALLDVEACKKLHTDYRASLDALMRVCSELNSLESIDENEPEAFAKYQELEESVQKKQADCDTLQAQLEANLIQLSQISDVLSLNYESTITSKVFRAYFEQRKAYLQTHKEAFQTLIEHHFDCSAHPYSRYKDNLNHAWSDLMPLSYYLGSLPKDKLKHADFKEYDSQIRLLPENERYANLKDQLNLYHSIPKTDEAQLGKRQEALKAIAHTAAALIKNSPQGLPSLEHEILQEIVARCNLKSHYLTQLTKLEAEALARVHKLPQEHALPNALQVISTKPHALHDLDPEKRYGLEDFHENWLHALQKDPNTPNFWLWLETQNTASLSKDLRHTFINQGLKHIQFKNGLAYNEMFRSFKPDSKGLIEDGQYIYNIGQDGDLYVLPEDKTLDAFKKASKVLFQNPIHSTSDLANHQNILNHDTILGGGNILCAGVVKFKDGKIVHIDTNSGHYMPDMNVHLKPALAYFLENNPGALEETTQISNYDNKINLSYAEFKNQKPSIPNTPSTKNHPTLESLGFKSRV